MIVQIKVVFTKVTWKLQQEIVQYRGRARAEVLSIGLSRQGEEAVTKARTLRANRGVALHKEIHSFPWDLLETVEIRDTPTSLTFDF